MGESTKIEWTNSTWNPVSGCSKVSQGCKNCYAKRDWKRLAGRGQPYAGRVFEDVATHLERLGQPLRFRRPRRIFVNSMSDLFHEDVPDFFIDQVFAVMGLAYWHTFQILTKRPERMHAYFERLAHEDQCLDGLACLHVHAAPQLGDTVTDAQWEGLLSGSWPLPNVWLGVSVEDQATADQRIPLLLDIPAAIRFLSCEPLLGQVYLRRWHCVCGWTCSESERPAEHVCPQCGLSAGLLFDYFWVDWVIAGGESGPVARPIHPDWARSLRDQCAAAELPFFFKQWGEWLPFSQYCDAGVIDDAESCRFTTMEWRGDRWDDVGYPIWCDFADGQIDDEQCVGRVGKKTAGRLLDGVTHDEMPL